MKFVVEGTMQLGEDERKFTKEVEAINENVARERIYNLLGATTGVKRQHLTIDKIEKI